MWIGEGVFVGIPWGIDTKRPPNDEINPVGGHVLQYL